MNILTMEDSMSEYETNRNSRTVRSFLGDTLSFGNNKRKDEQDRMSVLGISESEMTPTVKMALESLYEKIDDLELNLDKTRTQLEEMESLVDVDCLTPLPNRRAFMRRLNWALSMHERYGHDCTIAFFDLNGFKMVNDTYGHSTGDAVIQHAAELFDSMTRESDFLARLGGDEFAIVMYHANHEGATRRAKMIANKMKANPFRYNGQTIEVSTSYGTYQLQRGEAAEQALHKADLAMFENKRRQKELDGLQTA